jgi:hypothetical protein
MRVLGFALYLVGLIPIVIYILVLEVDHQRALEVPELIWRQNPQWVLEHARLYASALEGLVVIQFSLVVAVWVWMRQNNKAVDFCRFIILISIAVIARSMLTDFQRTSPGGLTVEILAIIFHVASLVFLKSETPRSR